MFVCVCVVSLSQPSSRDLLYVKCLCVCVVSLSQLSSRDLLYVKCLCVCVLSRYLNPVVEICCMLNVCVCVVSLSQLSSRDLLYVKCLCVCVVSLSQLSSRDLKCLCDVLSRYLNSVVEIWIILAGMFRTRDKKCITEKM